MRVNGNIRPNMISINPENAGQKCEVRITENIIEHSENNYDYDEYIFIVEYEDGLEQKILEHISEWISTGRNCESRYGASSVYHMEEDHTSELANLVEMLYEDGLEVIG